MKDSSEKKAGYFDLSHEQYKNVGFKETGKDLRFVSLKDRSINTCISDELQWSIQMGKERTLWQGQMRMLKYPLDAMTYLQIMGDIRPKTIIEMGTFTGSSADFLSMSLSHMKVDYTIYTVDYDPSNRHELASKNPNIKFLTGDLNKVEDIFPIELLKNLPHPIFYIDDAHVNTPGLLEYFHPYFQEGDYIVIEDTTINIPKDFVNERPYSVEMEKCGSTKHDEMAKFLEKYSEFYKVDTHYCDLWGYNATANSNGYIRRMK